MEIKLAHGQREIKDCFSVMSELRPHLSELEFVDQVLRMSNNFGYKLVYAKTDSIKAVAGFRISEWLHTGRYLEVDDLITTEDDRSNGYGSVIFDWLVEYGKKENCNQLKLVSGVARSRAHQFYERKGMKFEAKFFSISL
ncbi:MAG: GNAT family N-acetyltransferase [Kangiellaceae bacterium]|nr:GNAT family N-acetyltransferase [Kangiellaceae bacterium]